MATKSTVENWRVSTFLVRKATVAPGKLNAQVVTLEDKYSLSAHKDFNWLSPMINPRIFPRREKKSSTWGSRGVPKPNNFLLVSTHCFSLKHTHTHKIKAARGKHSYSAVDKLLHRSSLARAPAAGAKESGVRLEVKCLRVIKNTIFHVTTYFCVIFKNSIELGISSTKLPRPTLFSSCFITEKL